jgi:hypothetical protein
VTRAATGKDSVSGTCGTVMQSKPSIGRAALIAVAVAGSALPTGCGDRSATETVPTSTEVRAGAGSPQAGPPTGPAWTAAKALRHARRLTPVVDGRRANVDPTTVVCWGVGPSTRRDNARVWRRFNCIAPTFRGARAGPDVLFTLAPTSEATLRILKARFSSY